MALAADQALSMASRPSDTKNPPGRNSSLWDVFEIYSSPITYTDDDYAWWGTTEGQWRNYERERDWDVLQRAFLGTGPSVAVEVQTINNPITGLLKVHMYFGGAEVYSSVQMPDLTRLKHFVGRGGLGVPEHWKVIGPLAKAQWGTGRDGVNLISEQMAVLHAPDFEGLMTPIEHFHIPPFEKVEDRWGQILTEAANRLFYP